MPEADLALIHEAALAAGRIAARLFGGPMASRDKGDGQGPVSEADLEIDHMLRARLLAARPNYGWLSEETEDDAARLGCERVFIVDPIDGTRAFIGGQASFAHAIAVAERGEVVAAVVHLPMKGQTFLAARGRGATRNGVPIRASARALLEGARALTGPAQLQPELWPGGPPPVERHFRPSLAYRLCLVAGGRFDALITLRPTWEWDVAAGALIAAEAGAEVRTAEGAAPRYNGPRPALPGLIVAPPGLHRQIMARLGHPGEPAAPAVPGL
ncbi:MAG TPA: 3'(2'),5'-bisphosphate nucleotidase CysQ [Paracoccaceae bacterium]|nr:3'(2'),5'-bisphosphate nucleotidase CysQ [Paracoccaceae bacterium]